MESQALRELLAVDSLGTLNFFFGKLQDMGPFGRITQKETLYVASVLASYARSSREEKEDLPPMNDLSEVFEQFVLVPNPYPDASLLEMAGAQCLLLAGFFRDQMARRHNLPTYDRFGRSFYAQAGELTRNPVGKIVFPKVAENFGAWTSICSDLSRELRESRYILRLQ